MEITFARNLAKFETWVGLSRSHQFKCLLLQIRSGGLLFKHTLFYSFGQLLYLNILIPQLVLELGLLASDARELPLQVVTLVLEFFALSFEFGFLSL